MKPEHDFICISDGSGHSDGNHAGGGCCRLTTRDASRTWVFFNAKNHTSVERMELEVFLDALAFLTAQLSDETLKSRPHVLWLCDRRNLVWGATRDIETGDLKAERSTAAADLWARFEYLETIFHVHPVWVPRNSNGFQAETDAMAGRLRVLLRDFSNTNHTISCHQKSKSTTRETGISATPSTTSSNGDSTSEKPPTAI